MNNYVVAISIDKVQGFLYKAIHGHGQKQQLDSGTLKNIIGASNLISNNLYRDIGLEGDQGVFSDVKKDVLLQCSGKCIFMVTMDEKDLKEKLSQLFRKYYRGFNGQVLMKYIYFQKNSSSDMDKLKIIRRCEKELKEKMCLNQIIQEQHQMLFQFHDVDTDNWQIENHNLDVSMFVTEINELSDSDGSEAFDSQGNEKRGALYELGKGRNKESSFRIAVIKADFDGMGDLLKGMKDYNAYSDVSRILSEMISLKQLGEQTRDVKKKNPGFKLYPLYAAGDDLFYVVPMKYLLKGIDICKQILIRVNDKIESELNKRGLKLERSLSLSVGVDFTFNREPIRYYYHRVQQQLDVAKSKKQAEICNTKNKLRCMKICINQYVFYDYDTVQSSNKNQGKGSEKREKLTCEDMPNWRYFISDAKLIKSAMEKDIPVHHFCYGLLHKIQDPIICSDEVKYSNAVLYHLLPRYLSSPEKDLSQLELQLLGIFIERISKKRPTGNHGAFQKDLCFDSAHRKKLEAYVGLLLLFSDPRFEIVQQVGARNQVPFDGEKIREVRSQIFNRLLRYLYENSLLRLDDTGQSMRDIFVKEQRYELTEDKSNPRKIPKDKQPQIYRTLRISNSMFYRIKSMQKLSLKKTATAECPLKKGLADPNIIANMIEAVNSSKEEIEEQEIDRKANKKSPPNLYFKREEFLKQAGSCGSWDVDYLDSLLIFYALNKLSIQYKVDYPKANTGKGKKGRNRR